MKKLIVLSLLSFLAVTANAQDVFRRGTNIVNLGIGLGTHFPVEASFEHSIVDGLIKGENGAIGVGGYADWYPSNNFALGARATFHYQFVDRLDTYAGLILGYGITGNVSASSVLHSVFLGARYYFAPRVAVYSEISDGTSYLSAGIALKF
jgi:hypothetical protein